MNNEGIVAVGAFCRTHVRKSDLARLEGELSKSASFVNRKAKKRRNDKKTAKSKYMSRRLKKQLGLYVLPRKGMKYEDVLPMCSLWKQYMKQQLDLDNQEIPAIEDKAWDNFCQLIYKSDFHGASVTVTASKCPKLVGVSGICVIDTKNTFKLLCKDDVIRTISKEQCKFSFDLDDFEFSIFGKHINRRPAERSVKQSKMFVLSEL